MVYTLAADHQNSDMPIVANLFWTWFYDPCVFFTEKIPHIYWSDFIISSYDFPFVSGNTRTIKIPHTKHDAAKQNTIVPRPIISVSGSTTLSTKNAAMPRIVLQNVMPKARIFEGISSAVTLFSKSNTKRKYGNTMGENTWKVRFFPYNLP